MPASAPAVARSGTAIRRNAITRALRRIAAVGMPVPGASRAYRGGSVRSAPIARAKREAASRWARSAESVKRSPAAITVQ